MKYVVICLFFVLMSCASSNDGVIMASLDDAQGYVANMEHMYGYEKMSITEKHDGKNTYYIVSRKR